MGKRNNVQDPQRERGKRGRKKMERERVRKKMER